MPNHGLMPVTPSASSCRFARPTICGPAARRPARQAASASAGAADSATTWDPAVVGIPAMSIRSFTATRSPGPWGEKVVMNVADTSPPDWAWPGRAARVEPVSSPASPPTDPGSPARRPAPVASPAGRPARRGPAPRLRPRSFRAPSQARPPSLPVNDLAASLSDLEYVDAVLASDVNAIDE